MENIELVTNQNNEINKNSKTTRHQFAGPWIRAFARFLDLVLISAIAFVCSLIFLINSTFTINDFFKPIDQIQNLTFEGWRMFGMTIMMSLITFFYFCILPLLTKGYTLFKLIFKIKIGTKRKERNFVWLLFKHEFLITFWVNFFLIFLGICAWATNNPIALTKALFNFSGNFENEEYVFFALGTFLKTMFAFSGIIPAILFLYMLFHKNKLGLQDIVSTTFVYYIKQYEQNKKQENKIEMTKLEDLPGMNKNIISDPNSKSIEYYENLEKKSLIINLEERQQELKRKIEGDRDECKL